MLTFENKKTALLRMLFFVYTKNARMCIYYKSAYQKAMFNSEEIKKIEISRKESDKTLKKGGAQWGVDDVLKLTSEQIAEINSEMNDFFDEKIEHKTILQKLKKGLDKKNLETLEGFATELQEGIDDPEYARDRIMEMRKLISPIISVPKKYIREIKEIGYIRPHATWTGHKILAATFNREPYTNNDDRVYFEILPHVPLEPRFTSQSKDNDPLFKGIVIIPEKHGGLNINTDVREIN